MRTKQEFEFFGIRLKQLRKSKGNTQEELAYRINCSTTYISKLENGKSICSMERLFEISDVLQCDVSELLLGTNRNSQIYLHTEFSEQFQKLSSHDKEIICMLMKCMLEKTEEGIPEYAVP